MSAGSFIVTPWECDIVAVLAETLLAGESAQQADLSRHLLIFPHRRPRSYLLRALMADPRLPHPCRPPEVISSAQLFSRLRIDLEMPDQDGQAPLAGEPGRIVGRLDRVGVLQECVAELAAESREWGGPLSYLPLDDPTLFTPWGLRLQDLLEEFRRADLEPKNLLYPEQQPHPFAAALLQQLGDVATRYDRRMRERGWTTPGQDARLVAGCAEEACTLLAHRQIVLAGFNDLDAVEEKLFRALWERGASFYVQGDSALAEGRAPHWSCGSLQTLARRWRAKPELACLTPRDRKLAPCFHEGFDLHSQLDALQRELAALPEPIGLGQGPEEKGEYAVVLPETGLLMPVLHHVPRKERINISMGYPLSRSPLARLLECLLRLQENAQSPEAYYWKDIVELIRHPYLKMLSTLPADPDDPQQQGDTLHRAFQAYERAIRHGQALARPLSWEPLEEDGGWRDLARETEPKAVQELFRRAFTACLSAWEQVASLDDAARALQGLCELLVEHGGELWQRFPIDAECLHRLLYSVIPALRQCALAKTPLPKESVFAILRDELSAERVPFESPSSAEEQNLQVLGLLETRCISFDTVFLLDATDDLLPGAPAADPLLPDALRRMLGLPDSRRREERVAHAFFRLLHGANRVELFYQDSMEGGSLWDDKRIRSRFVEELLWNRERELGRVLEPGAPPVHAVSYPIHSPSSRRRVIAASDASRRALDSILGRGLSPSALDEYLRCPARFFYSRIAGLEPMAEVGEEGDPREIGELVHSVLEEFFGPLKNRLLHAGTVDPESLLHTYREQLRASDFYPRIPQDQRLMLERTGEILLRRTLENLPQTTILALETQLQGALPPAVPGGRSVVLRGKADRIDQRQDGQIVLDYKTGKAILPHKNIWEDETLFARLRTWPDCEEPELLLPELAERLKSVQLPCYCLMYSQQSGAAPWDAGIVSLAEGGKEHFLFGKKMEGEERTAVIEDRVPDVLGFLLRHMMHSDAFAPQEGSACGFCDFEGPCLGGAGE